MGTLKILHYVSSSDACALSNLPIVPLPLLTFIFFGLQHTEVHIEQEQHGNARPRL